MINMILLFKTLIGDFYAGFLRYSRGGGGRVCSREICNPRIPKPSIYAEIG
jgi:hypothetical protein